MATTNINMTTNPVVLATKGTYCDKDIQITAALQEKTITPTTTTQTITPAGENVGLSKVVVNAVPTETKTATAGTSATTITPTSGKFLTSVTINPTPSEERLVTPKANAQVITPNSGKLLSSVTVDAVPTEEKTATINGEVTPSSGRFLSKVIVNVPSVIDVTTAAEMDAKLVAGNMGKVYRFTGTTDSTYTNGDLYEVVSE